MKKSAVIRFAAMAALALSSAVSVAQATPTPGPGPGPGVSARPASAPVMSAEQFKTLKENILGNMKQRAEMLEKERACVQKTKGPEDLKNCQNEMRAARQALQKANEDRTPKGPAPVTPTPAK
ncbi:hypothetical protein LC612_31865 [Nostoc sp. CHAB 5834]|nr:hypothetical protein [Nostoc sp. CHAB 5834]